MNKALLWAGCCLILFVAFLWVNFRPKPVRARDLSLSQPLQAEAAHVMEAPRSVKESAEPAPIATAAPEPKPSPVRPSPAPMDLTSFRADEILALPFPEQKKFLLKNQLQDPEKFARFRTISYLNLIEEYLKGDFRGTMEGQHGEQWTLHLMLDGAVEDQHFQGEITVELLDKSGAPISRSHLRGPLDDHIRVVEEGERRSLLVAPTGPDNVRLYQIFIGGKNKQQLMGNYYARQGEGKLQLLGSFVLKKGEL